MVAAAPASPAPRVASGTELVREYVLGGRLDWYQQALHALPWHIDDLTADLGDDLYERMLRDPQVAGCIAVWKASIIEDGATLSPATPADPEDSGAVDAAKALADAATTMLEELDTPLDDVLWNLLDAAPYGSKVGELLWALEDTGGDLRLNLRAIKPKPRRRTSFVVDQYMNVVGLLAARPGQPIPQLGGAGIFPGSPGDLIPRDKFVVLSFRPVDNDPRGTSLLRGAYDPWFRKRQILPEYVKYLGQFAGPGLIGVTSPDAELDPAEDDLGNPTGAVALTQEEALAQLLSGYKNATAIAVPAGTTITVVQSQGEGKAFLNALQHCDQQIVVSILTQTLATMDSEHQARAAAQVHQDVLETLIRQAKKAVVRLLHRVLRLWVSYNWGPAFLPLVPRVTLGSTEKRQQPALISAMAQWFAAGGLAQDQLPAIDDLLGLPRRDPSLMPPIDPATGLPVDPNAAPAPAPVAATDPAAADQTDAGTAAPPAQQAA